MAQTKIEWAERIANPIKVKGPGRVWNFGYHCTKVSTGCANCYSEKLNILRGTGQPYDNRKVDFYLDLSVFDRLPKKPCRVFVQSMGDLFHEDVPFEFIEFILDRAIACPQHQFLILTKRPERMFDWSKWEGFEKSSITPNLWLGVTAENQEQADKRIPILLQIPAAVRFVSIEPYLSEINIEKYLHCGISWCIIGSESGSKARPMDENWVRSLVCQCKKNNVAIFYKQKRINGKMVKIPELDGKIYAEYPQTIGKQNDL